MKTVIYSAVYGPIDWAPKFVGCEPTCDCILYTDEKMIDDYLKRKKSQFKVILTPAPHSDPRKACRLFKACPHRYLYDYDVSLWVDANTALYKDPVQIIKSEMKDKGYAVYQHWNNVRNAYEEARRCIQQKKITQAEIAQQLQFYAESGYTEDGIIGACGYIMRKHNNESNVKFGEAWWEQIEKYSNRDQISWAYCRWLLNFKHDWIETSRHSWLGIAPHKRRVI